MVLRLEIEEDGKRRAVRFSEAELTIGRGPDNSVVIGDPRSSRHHCRIVRTPQGLLLEDLKSRNGTLLNGSAVQKSFIKSGDEFRIGNARFVLADEGSSPPREEEDDGLLEDAPAPEVGQGSTWAGQGESCQAEPPRLHEQAPVSGGLAPTVAIRARPDLPSISSRRIGGSTRKAAASAEAYLEGVEGAHAGETIRLEKVPFVLGRGKECDFSLRDQRASGRHACISREPAGFYIEDLGSKNGTTVNKRAVKRAVLSPGAIIQIGNSSFRAQVPAPLGDKGVRAAESAAPAAEEFVEFDVDKFLERGRAQHPLAVLAVVFILAILGYFSVDITRRLLERQEPDPVLESNRISQNWSFEEKRKEREKKAEKGDSTVPGWRIAEGDEGRMETTQEHAQLPGNQALRLVSTAEEGLCRATYDGDILLGSDRTYRVEGFVLNEGAFAAGLLVEWLRVSGTGQTEVGRSFSETVHQDGEALDVNQIILAPPSASHARVSCHVLGRGRAVFDRISFRPEGSTSEKEAGNAEDLLEKGAKVLRLFRSGPDEDPVLVALGNDGIFAITRKKKQLVPALWAGLPPEQDPNAFGPRLSLVRTGALDSTPLLLEGEVPDEMEKRWVAVETAAALSGGDVALRWRTAAPAEGQPSSRLCLYLEVREGLTPVQVHKIQRSLTENGPQTASKEAPGKAQAPSQDAVQEMVVGEGQERVSLSFSEPVKLSSKRHPHDRGRSLWIAEGMSSGLEVKISHTSKHEADAARAQILAAEEELRAGHFGAAVDMLAKLPQLFPEEKAEIRRAQERIEAWKKEASEAISALEPELAELRRTPTPVLYDLILVRATLLKDRYAGTPEGNQAEKVLEEAKQFWLGRGEKKKAEDLRSLYEKARQHFARNELSLAEVYFRWVLDADPQGEMARSSEQSLRLIEARRKGAIDILLQQPSQR